MGLVELGKHTGLAAAMLSKLERGKLFPTLPTLLRIALVFGVGLEYFFSDERKRHVVAIARKKERLRFPDSPDGRSIAYNFESLDFKATERKLNGFYAEFEPVAADKSRPHQHYLIKPGSDSRGQVRDTSPSYGLSTSGCSEGIPKFRC